MALAAVLKFEHDEVRIFFTFHRPTIDALKGLGIGARWDKAGSFWAVPESRGGHVFRMLDGLGYIWEVASEPKPEPAEYGDGWSETLFNRAPGRLHAPLFRAIADVVDPDQGGDEGMMRELSASWSAMCRTA